MDLILANGKIVTAHESYDADIGIEDGVIKQIGHGLGPAGRTVDCTGKLLFPGGVDVHTHVEFELMGQETADDFHSSTVAAACGGITTICDYAFPEPGQSLQDCLVRWNQRGEKSVIDYGLHPTIFQPGEHTLSEMRDCVADGYTSFKIFMIGFSEFDRYAPEYLRCMEEAGKLGAMVNIHCEDQCCITYMTKKLEEENNSNVRTFPIPGRASRRGSPPAARSGWLTWPTCRRTSSTSPARRDWMRSTTRAAAARPATARAGRSTSTSRASASTRRWTPSATSAGRRCARPTRWR